MVYFNSYWHSKFRVFGYPGINARHWIVFQHFFSELSPLFFENHFLKNLFWFSSEKMKNVDRAAKCIAARTLTMSKPKNKNVFKKMPKCGELHFALKHFLANFLSFWIVWFCTLLLISITYFFATFYEIWLLFTNFFFAFWLRKMYSKFGKHGKISTQSNRNNILIRF